jgi:Fungal chitosanase of glycosyl hydrolase group 75
MEQFSGARRWRSMQMVRVLESDDSADRNWIQTRVRMTRRFTFPIQMMVLPSEAVSYIVLPGATFRTNTGLAIGDVALVIFKDKIAAAVCGDIGPSKKIGEGSIRLHEALHPPAPDPCSLRQPDGSCKRILNASIEEDVLFFVFPKSSFGEELTVSNLETLVNERAFALYNKFRGAT